MYPLSRYQHAPDNCPACTVRRRRTEVTDRDRESFAYWVSDPTAGHLFLTV